MTGGASPSPAVSPGGGTLYYVYGIVPPATDAASAPAGMEGAAVSTVESRSLAALVSQLDAHAYSPELIEERVGDVEWLAPRAEAHDAVVSWAGHPGPVVPLHMWAMFSGRDGVIEMLEKRASELVPLLERLRGADEYGLRVYADPTALEQIAAGSDPVVAELERTAASAGPGQRYLIERKLEGARRDAARLLASSRADAIHAALAAQSVAAARDAIPTAASDGSAVLSAAFLVRRDALDPFRAALTSLVRETEPEGFRFAFTGPWPPYHFAAGSGN
ncbi:MAG TPA: GvpL/GvpF family gas vesicle protein [Gemmatimonadaceae bacterium]